MDLQQVIGELNRFMAVQANKARVHKCKGENVAKGNIKVTTTERVPNWHGPYAPTPFAVTRSGPNGKTVYLNKGVKKQLRMVKRTEAEQRNRETPIERRRAHRRVMEMYDITSEEATELMLGATNAPKRSKKRKKVRK